MNKKAICFAAAAYAVIVTASAIMLSDNRQLDVVARYAAASFLALGQEPEVTLDDGWPYVVRSPGGAEQFSYGENVRLIIAAAPFIAAGLYTDRLEEGGIIAENYYLIFTSEDAAGAQSADNTIEALINSNRRNIHYHMEHDLFELELDGHAFRWARDTQKNTLGMAFVLDPEPLIQAGLDPHALEGWSLVDITLNHGRGNTVPRLIKNYSFITDIG